MDSKIEEVNIYTAQQHEKYIFFFEMLGTIILTYAIGCSHDTVIGHQQNFVHCISLLLPLALAGQISGGYFNSTITIAAYINKKHKIMGKYLIAQFLGGLIGTAWCWVLTDRILIAYKRDNQNLAIVKFIINEFLGSFLFSICVLVLTNKFTTHAYKSWQIYISIAASFYLVRKMTGDTPLNPNSCIFYQMGSWLYYKNTDYLIDLWLLVVPSTVGGICGGFMMHKCYEPLLLFIRFKDQDLPQITNKNSFTSSN